MELVPVEGVSRADFPQQILEPSPLESGDTTGIGNEVVRGCTEARVTHRQSVVPPMDKGVKSLWTDDGFRAVSRAEA